MKGYENSLEGQNKFLCSITSDSWDLVVIVTSIEHPILNYVVFWDDHFLISFRLFPCSAIILFALTLYYSRSLLLFFGMFSYGYSQLCDVIWVQSSCANMFDTVDDVILLKIAWYYFVGHELTNWISFIASAFHGRLLIKPELFMVCSHIAWFFLLNAFLLCRLCF
jgi:hypothetical protein